MKSNNRIQSTKNSASRVILYLGSIETVVEMHPKMLLNWTVAIKGKTCLRTKKTRGQRPLILF